MKLVAALKMLPTPKQATCLTATLERCNAACSWLAERGFESQTFRQYDLHKMGYVAIRERFGLTAQAAVRSISKVADAFKVSREGAPVFRADAAQPYDDRIIRFVKDGSAVSLWTVEGRIVLPIVMGEHQKRLLAFRKGEVDLCFVRGKWMLAATCDIPETDEFKAEDWLGVDLGIVSLAVDSDDAKQSKLLDMTNVIYAAGLFDGEGCITMWKRSGGSRPRLRVSVSGAYLPTIEWLKDSFGGTIQKGKPTVGKRGAGKAVHFWRDNTIAGCLKFLQTIRPFLREKADQADLAILYLERRSLIGLGAGWLGHDPGLDAMAAEICRELSRLKGTAPEVLAA
jgi:hypothetical protein